MAKLSEKTKERIKRLKDRCEPGQPRSLILQVLILAMEELRKVDTGVLHLVAKELDMPLIWVKEVASWYSMIFEEGVGKYHVRVCKTLSCSLMGALTIIEYVGKKLNLKAGQTSEDKKFTFSLVECLGACDQAPVMQVNEETYEQMTPEKIDKLLDGLE